MAEAAARSTGRGAPSALCERWRERCEALVASVRRAFDSRALRGLRGVRVELLAFSCISAVSDVCIRGAGWQSGAGPAPVSRALCFHADAVRALTVMRLLQPGAAHVFCGYTAQETDEGCVSNGMARSCQCWSIKQ